MDDDTPTPEEIIEWRLWRASGGAALEVDWPALFHSLGFNEQERSLLLSRLKGEGRVHLARRLGSRTVEKLRRAVNRRLRRLRGLDLSAAVTILRSDPSRTMLLERLESGGLVWRHR